MSLEADVAYCFEDKWTPKRVNEPDPKPDKKFNMWFVLGPLLGVIVVGSAVTAYMFLKKKNKL